MNTHPIECASCAHLSTSHLSALDAEGLGTVSKNRVCLSFKKGQTIFHEGMRVNGVYCVHGGIGKLMKLGPKGKDQILSFVQPGEIAGYRAMVSNDPMIGTLIAHTEVKACFIPKDIFLTQIKENPKFSFKLLEASCHELGEWGKVISNMSQKTVRERLAELLLVLRSTFGVHEEGYIDLQLSREELANMVGTATESLIRLMTEMKKEGLISTQGKKITVENDGALKVAADLMY